MIFSTLDSLLKVLVAGCLAYAALIVSLQERNRNRGLVASCIPCGYQALVWRLALAPQRRIKSDIISESIGTG